GQPLNSSGVDDPKLTEMIRLQRRTYNVSKRREIVYDIQRHLAEQVYYHYDPSTTTVSAWEPYVKNFAPNIGHDYVGRLLVQCAGGPRRPPVSGHVRLDHDRRAAHLGLRPAAIPEAHPARPDPEHPAPLGVAAGRHGAAGLRRRARLQRRGAGHGHGGGRRGHRGP